MPTLFLVLKACPRSIFPLEKKKEEAAWRGLGEPELNRQVGTLPKYVNTVRPFDRIPSHFSESQYPSTQVVLKVFFCISQSGSWMANLVWHPSSY